MTIALTPEIESVLTTYSQQRGMTPDELAQQLLLDKLQELEDGQEAVQFEAVGTGETLADRFAGRLGVVSSKNIVSARETGKQFAEILLEKRSLGKI